MKRTFLILVGTALTLASTGRRASATELTFNRNPPYDNNESGGFGGVINQDYGDNVAGASQPGAGGTYLHGTAGGVTLNVVVDYLGQGGVVLVYANDGTGFSQMPFGLYLNTGNFANPGTLTLTFTADPGFEVTLTSLKLAAYASNYTLDSLTVTGDPLLGPLSLMNTTVPGSGPPLTVAINRTGPTLTLTLDDSFDLINIGMSNIQFSQSVPEPGSAGLVALGGLGLLCLQDRSRRMGGNKVGGK